MVLVRESLFTTCKDLATKQAGDSNKRVVQVAIADEHLLIREALHRVIESFPQVRVYASLNRVQDIPAAFEQERGDVLIIGSSLSV